MAGTAAHAATILLMFVILPAWTLAGLTDYFCHRAAHIEQNAGPTESVMHLIQYSLVGVPTALALFLQINAAFFLLAAIAILLHHTVAYIDVRYANARRRVSPFEQMVHSFLEIMPIAGFLLLAVLHWGQLVALLGGGTEAAELYFYLKRDPLPLWYVAVAIGAALLLNLLPYLEELLRCVRVRSRRPG